MESGVDIYTIKRWLGHTSLVTTGRYMHVTAEHQATVKSPLDTLCDAPPVTPGAIVRQRRARRSLDRRPACLRADTHRQAHAKL